MRKTLLLLVTLFLIVGCEDSATRTEIRGEWSLVNVNGGLLGTNSNFKKETIVWNFGNSKVIVINKNTDQTLADSFATGQYDYMVQDQNEGEVLIIEEQNLGLIQLDGNLLTVDQRPVDGFQLVFSR